MIFNKDNDTVECKQLKVLTAKHRRLLQLLYTVGGDQAKLNGVQKSQLVLGGGVEASREQSYIIIFVKYREVSTPIIITNLSAIFAV
jgi:hypothetical protein